MIVGCTPLGGHVNKKLSDSHYYNATKTSIIYGRNGNCLELGCTEIENADVDTFKVLNSIYASDKNSVYFRDKKLDNESPNSFRLAKGPYAIGQQGGYWWGEIFKVKDPVSFSAVEFLIGNSKQHFAFDEEFVYCRKNIISNSPDSFLAIEKEGYFKDDSNLFYINGGVCDKMEVDIDSFTFLMKRDGTRSVYAKDANYVYLMSVKREIIKGADVSSFKALCSGRKPPQYAIDKNHVYDFGEKIIGALPETYAFPSDCKPEKTN